MGARTFPDTQHTSHESVGLPAVVWVPEVSRGVGERPESCAGQSEMSQHLPKSWILGTLNPNPPNRAKWHAMNFKQSHSSKSTSANAGPSLYVVDDVWWVWIRARLRADCGVETATGSRYPGTWEVTYSDWLKGPKGPLELKTRSTAVSSSLVCSRI